MAMRILLADVSAKVTATLLAVKTGCEGALNQGLVLRLPEKVDFQVDVITAAQSLVSENTQTTTETDSLARTVTRVEGTKTTVGTQSGGTGTSTTQATSESGGDTITTDYTYDT